jgi:large subunit ribosomal protein L23
MRIKHSLITEKASILMEKENSLQFIVDRKAKKDEIRKDLEELFDVKVVSIRTLITPKGEKKAIVKLSDEYDAKEILTRLKLY